VEYRCFNCDNDVEYTPFISVVVPAYNEEIYLPACLESLQKQTYPPDKFEVIIADNNSKDMTAEIARSSGATVIQVKNQGHAYALAAGIQAAKGEIVAATDADTVVSRNWLNMIERAFRDQKVVAVTGAVFYDTSNELLREWMRRSSYYGYLFYQRLHFAIGKTLLAGNNLAVRRGAYNEISGIDTRYEIFSDQELGLRIKKVGKVKFDQNIGVATSARRWEKGTLDDYYKYVASYFQTTWIQKPPRGSLTPRR
jgi:glycosyltransferase involved in cell wall biosynthesis